MRKIMRAHNRIIQRSLVIIMWLICIQLLIIALKWKWCLAFLPRLGCEFSDFWSWKIYSPTSGWFLPVVNAWNACECLDTTDPVSGEHLSCIKSVMVILKDSVLGDLAHPWVRTEKRTECVSLCLWLFIVSVYEYRQLCYTSFLFVWKSWYLHWTYYCLLSCSELVVHVPVTRCHPVYLVGRLSAILGWRSTQVICTDQSRSFWRELPHFQQCLLASSCCPMCQL